MQFSTTVHYGGDRDSDAADGFLVKKALIFSREKKHQRLTRVRYNAIATVIISSTTTELYNVLRVRTYIYIFIYRRTPGEENVWSQLQAAANLNASTRRKPFRQFVSIPYDVLRSQLCICVYVCLCCVIFIRFDILLYLCTSRVRIPPKWIYGIWLNTKRFKYNFVMRFTRVRNVLNKIA